MASPAVAIFQPAAQRGERVLLAAGSRQELPLDDACVGHLGAASATGTLLLVDFPAEHCETLQGQGARTISLNVLASLLLPRLDEWSLSAVSEALDVPVAPDAPDEAARLLYRRLLEMLDAQPAAALALASRLLALNRSNRGLASQPIADVFEAALKKRVPDGMSDARALSDYNALFMGRDLRFRLPPIDESSGYLLDGEAVAWHFSPGGPLAQVMADYEERPGQTLMAGMVAQALRDGRHLVVEAGTGVGKSLAYLYPAAVSALSTGRRIVVVTNTKTLQAQLLGRDIPLLAHSLPVPLRAAMLKGRRNYLCLRKLLRSLFYWRYSGAEAQAMTALVLWAAESTHGDISENVAFMSHASPELWLSLVSTQEECMGRQCRWYKACFLRQTRARAHEASIIIVNYALLMASLAEEGELIPAFDEIVLDEAQHLEDAASEALSVLVAQWRLRRFLRALGGADGRGGLIEGLGKTLGGVTGDAREYKVLAGLLHAAAGGLDACRAAGEQFFDAALALAAESEDARVRYEAGSRNPAKWQHIVAGKEALVKALATVLLPLERVLEETEPAAARRRRMFYEDPADPSVLEEPTFSENYRELAGQLDMARELVHDIDFVVTAAEPNHVYWLERYERQGRPEAEFRATPVEVAGTLFELLYSRKRCVIFTSATLSVDGKFDFFMSRSGAGFLAEARAEQVESPFDYERQARLLIPTWLPEPLPGSQDFPLAFADMAERAARASGGRALVLFTSHRMLREVADVLRPRLTAAGLEVMQQELDGPREALLGRFRRNTRGVLLGTASFWEGIDVKGQSLSLLILAKLPFPVHTDPLIQARQENEVRKGGDPFQRYLLPVSVLRLRQGFGRLIRSKQDAGVVIIADKRLLTRRYGGTFLRSLPVRHRPVTSPAALERMLRRFFERGGSVSGDFEYYYDGDESD